jgi:small ligand-binding sensory domain FIST
MPFTSCVSSNRVTARAVDEVCNQALSALPGKPDLALAFFSREHGESVQTISTGLHERLGGRCLVGCMGEGIVSNEHEIEKGPALALWLGRWPTTVTATPFHLEVGQTGDGPCILGWPDALLTAVPAESALLVLGDPFTFPVDLFLSVVNQQYPGLRVVGGMSSGGRGPGQSRLIEGEGAHFNGAVGVLVEGANKLRCIVSQGCRPIGTHMVITRANDNVILELGGKPPLERLHQIWEESSPRDRELLERGLYVGRVINEYRGDFSSGDFLVRNVVHIDDQTGAIAITDRVRIGQTMQFHVRDADSADADLHRLLQLDKTVYPKRPSSSALVFTCNGRGTRLFPKPHHDARAIRQELGPIPLAGYFAMGELGPVGGQNFIHGFTASVALFAD